MVKGHWLHGLLAVLTAGSLLLFTAGCNEGTNFDPDELFSIEDYAQDQDYAIHCINMMNSWHRGFESAKQQLDTNNDGLTFTESVPAGWKQVNASLRTYPWSVLFVFDPVTGQIVPASDAQQWLQSDWFFSSFQDANYELAAFDRNVPAGVPFEPAKVEYMRLRFSSSPLGAVGFGDSVMVAYADNFQNPSALTGAAKFWNSDVVQAQTAPNDIASYAAMVNSWRGTITHMSSQPGNPQGEFQVEGETQLIRADEVEQATLPVRINASVRSNANGDASIRVDGIERARVFFQFYDTRYHGYYELNDSNFQEKIVF